MRLHSMTYASEQVTNPRDVPDPFLSKNPDAYDNSSDPAYNGDSPTVTLAQSCIWPPKDGADPTAYRLILVAKVPGSLEWPGVVMGFAYADVIDTACYSVGSHVHRRTHGLLDPRPSNRSQRSDRQHRDDRGSSAVQHLWLGRVDGLLPPTRGVGNPPRQR